MPPLAPSVPLFNQLKWLPFYKDVLISKCIIAYKWLQSDVPVYLNNLLKLNSNIHSRQTRYCNFNLISPRYNRETEGGRTFTVATCKAWNSLSLPVRQRDSVDSLKKHCGMNFLNNGRILIFLFKLLDKLWDDYNAIFYLLNNLGDSIVSVFFGFYLYFL